MTAAERDRVVAPEYWEVGASGRRYSREFILKGLEEKPPVDAAEAGGRVVNLDCGGWVRRFILLTYTLDQAGRVTRRSTVWQKTGEGWEDLVSPGKRS